MHGHADLDRIALHSPRLLTGPLGWAANPLLRRGMGIPTAAAMCLALVVHWQARQPSCCCSSPQQIRFR